MQVKYSGKYLHIGDKSYKFNFDIGDVLIDEDYVFVRLSLPIKPEYKYYARNIYGFKNGELIWQMQNVHEVYPLWGPMPSERIMMHDENTLVSVDFSGGRLLIDKYTGKITGSLPGTK